MIRFGQPLTLTGNANDNDAHIGERVDQIRDRIASLIEAGRQEYSAL
jgi:hypothetical protein